MKKTISILSVFTISFFYSQENNNKEYRIKKNNSLNDLNLSIFNKNYDDLGENIYNYNSIDNNIVAIRYENLSEIENTTYKVDRMLENKYIYKADKTKTYWS